MTGDTGLAGQTSSPERPQPRCCGWSGPRAGGSGGRSRVHRSVVRPLGTAWHLLLVTGLLLSQLAVNGQDLAAGAAPAPPVCEGGRWGVPTPWG